MWAVIAPSLLIFLANIGFFIMTAKITWQRHMRKDVNKTVQNVFGWLKSTVPLVFIMGLTWVLGLVVLNVRELVFLAYIYNVAVAFQGLFIFVILVLLSKAVRDYFINIFSRKFNKVSFEILLINIEKFVNISLFIIIHISQQSIFTKHQ